MKDYETMNLKELRSEAKKEGIKYYYRLKKVDLIKKLKEKSFRYADKEKIISIINSNPQMAEVRKIASILGIKLKRNMKKIEIIHTIKEKLSIQTKSSQSPKNSVKTSFSSSSTKTSPFPKERESKRGSDKISELPETYNKDKLVCLPVNPHLIHIYWDFSAETLEKLKEAKDIKLRVYDVTYIIFNGKNAHRTFEVGIDPTKIKNYYFNVPNARANYIAEIGYKGSSEFIPVLRSNLVETPPNGPGNLEEEVWVDLKTLRKSKERSQGMILRPIEKLIVRKGYDQFEFV